MRPLSRLFADAGVSIVASTYSESFALQGLDRDNPIESMARAYTSVFGNRSEDFKTGYIARRYGQFNVDAAVYHDCRTTPEASHVRYGLAQRVQRATGVPSFVIEADSHDLRLFSTDRIHAQLSAFLEHHAEFGATNGRMAAQGEINHG
jgi:benzoyl-CoA reductase/2-hydroxyglutaryl-CoA dehydratase subunit BcrC/BadD/HgdB